MSKGTKVATHTSMNIFSNTSIRTDIVVFYPNPIHLPSLIEKVTEVRNRGGGKSHRIDTFIDKKCQPLSKQNP